MKKILLCFCMILGSGLSFIEIHSSQESYDISFHVVDEFGKGLEGITFILEQFGDEVLRATSDELGNVLLTQVAYGEYILYQDNRIAGNDTMKHPITLRMNDKTPKRWVLNNIINECSKGSVSLQVMGKDKKIISGMKLKIMNEEHKVVRIIKSDEEGSVVVNELPVGKYYLQQSSLNHMYTMQEDTMHFLISRDQNYTLQLHFDKKISKGLELGNQYALFLFFSMSICLSGGCIFYVRRLGWKHFFDHFMV